MSYEVTITSKDGKEQSYPCGGVNDQDALIYAGKIVEANAISFSDNDAVNITKDGKKIGPIATVREMTTRAV